MFLSLYGPEHSSAAREAVCALAYENTELTDRAARKTRLFGFWNRSEVDYEYRSGHTQTAGTHTNIDRQAGR